MKTFRECALALLLAGCGSGGGGGGEPAAPVTPTGPPIVTDLPALTRVSASSPFAPGCDAVSPTGTSYQDAEVEPFLAVNPANTQNLFAVWQQDRWSDGGSHGLGGAVSLDGGATWTPSRAPFSRCAGGSIVNGGDYDRASDPWVSFGPDGHAYWMALSFSADPNAMLVSRSLDGGQTWEAPKALIADGADYFNDKNSLTADPTDAHFVYAVWDRVDFTVPYDDGPTYFARSTDGGASWEAARSIYEPGPDHQTIGNQIAVLADGTLVDVLTELHFPANAPSTATLRAIRSTDHGASWSAPVTIASMNPVGASDPSTGQPIRDGGILPSIAVSPAGPIYVVWQDSRFSGGARDGIALSTSMDNGLHWSAPVQVNRVHTTPAFTASVAVAGNGTIGVTYSDLRNDDAGASLPVDTWLATSADGVTFAERRLASGDLTFAPVAAGAWFVGDYQGLLAIGSNFRALFARPNAVSANRTDVYTVQVPSLFPSAAKVATSYKALAAPADALTPEALRRVSARVLAERHRPPDKGTPVTRDD